MKAIEMAANEMPAKQWFLYGNDLDLARQQLGLKISKTGENPTGYQQQLKLISLLTYIGAYDDCENWLRRVQGHSQLIGQQSTYRILRRRGEPNPWRGLLGGQGQQQLEQAIEQRFAQGLPLAVDLVGGIGDQLETAALLLASRSGLPRPEALWLRPSGENSGVVRALLAEVPGLPLEPSQGIEGSWHVTAPWFRFWMGLRGLEQAPAGLLQDPQPAPGGGGLLVCWRCKPDPANPLSSFSRSLPFPLILELYGRWQGAATQASQLLDMGDYNPEEVQILGRQAPWVQLVRQQIRGLSDTRKLMAQCGAIATVDTSLGHLAVACGRQVQLLLPQFPDERWYDLLGRDSRYRQLVVPHRQEGFHRWQGALASLEKQLGIN